MMASSETDHNYYTLSHRRRPSQLSNSALPYDSADDLQSRIHTSSPPPPSKSVPPLSSYPSRSDPSKAPLKRPTVSTNFDGRGLNALRHTSIDDASPDPHEFYRQYRDPFANAPGGLIGQGSILVSPVERGMTSGYLRKTSVSSVQSNGTLSLHSSQRPTHRSASISSTKSPLNTTKSTPVLSAASGKSRQGSLKDLVDKFNQTPDELPPLPKPPSSKPASRATSRTVSPAGSAGQYSRSRNTSLSKPSGVIGQGPYEGRRQSRSSVTSFQRREVEEQQKPSVQSSLSHHPGGSRRQSITTNSNASQSLTNLNPPATPTTRKPLFGEIVSLNTNSLTPGYGISSPRRRRGSEGSMHSPNPMFTDTFSELNSGISPSSPTAWYLGYTPSLDAINPNRPTDNRPSHRRTQSDLASINRPTNASSLSTHMATMSPPPDISSGGNSGSASKRNSHSKIPVSTRRLSATSDSGHSSSSTAANSAMGRYNTPKANSSRPPSSLPKSMQQITVSPPRHTQTPAMAKSPGRRDMGQKPTSSPLLKANIIAPLPKKSPPLRSSRPRQPVSSASTSASRAKVVERLNTLETQDRHGKDRTKSKQSKMLPELGKVDFAARRQKIQQAFNKTVQENEIKEERAAERRRLVHEQQKRDQQQALASQHALERPIQQQFSTDDENDPSHEEEETYATPNEEFPQRQLTIDTLNISGHKIVSHPVRYNDDDSPTLGVPSNVATANTEFPPSASDMPPMSAMTTDTTDTADTAETDSTTFENEPQTDRPRPNPLHRTVLSQIMQMRESSPGSQSHSDHGDDSLSERDDKESIQIMLRETPSEETPPALEDASTGENKDRQSSEIIINRFSTSSWTSSIRDRQSTDWAADGPMEKIEETSPQPDSSDHHSFTTADSNHTPQSWSPATFTSPQTTHSTTDSAVGQSLPLHRDAALLSPATRQSYIQQILTQSPDLARQGGWDPKRVTQLYLQELARGTSRRQAAPAPLKLQRRETEETGQEGGSSSQLSPEMARERTSEDSRPSMDSMDYEASSSPVDQRVIHRASMNSREDWEHNSPSVLEWMHPEGYEDSPVDNSEPSDGPTPPPKEVPLLDREGAETPRVTTTKDGPKLPEIDTGGALGLAIHVQSPQDSDSPTIPPPPLPTHSPPPPPPVRSKSADVVGGLLSSNSISPSIYDSNPPSSVFPTVTTAGIITGMTTRGSGDSALPSSSNTTTSAVNSRSSTQDRPSFDHRPSTDTQAKLSTLTPEQRRLNKRRHVIKELIDTEHSFGRDMKVVDDIYKGTSSSCLDLSVEDVKILFGNSDQIVQFSINFLDALKQAGKPIYVMPKAQRYKNSRASTATGASGTVDETASANGTELSDEDKDRQTFIGAVFGQNMARMEKVYSEYLKNHDAANKKLQALQQNPKVLIWLKECRQWAADLTTAWDLDSLLVKPVQRVLKYPLLLAQLLEATPEDHPDFTAIDVAVREMTGVSFRINEMKKRADVVEQVINSRKRKESDVRTGLQKAFGRRTEKLRQQVGLSDMFEDRQYNMLEEKFGSNFFQLQVVMRDVEMYTSDVQNYMNRFYDFVQAIEAYIDVGQSSHPEMESKWRKFRMSVKEISATALAEHLSSIRKSVIEPMITLLKMHDGPQRVISKRNKRLLDYARFKAMKDRGDKPDKKTTDQGEQFNALNVALKDELPKLFSLTAQLMEACLNNFVQIQTVWLNIWQRKLSFAIDEHGIPEDVGQIIHQWTGDFTYTEAQVLTLGICNGSLLADTVNLVNFLTPSTTLNGDETSSPRRPSTFGSNNRSASLSNDASPIVPPVDFGKRYSGNYTTSPHSEMYQHQNLSQPHANVLNGRDRASSAVSGTPDMPLGQRSSTTPASGPRPSTSTGRSTEPSPALPRLSIDTPAFNHLNPDRSSPMRPFSGQSGQSQNYFSNHPNNQPSPSPGQRYSGFFSSAMPMSDSPRTQTPGVDRMPAPGQSLHVLFLAASVYEFNIDRARREAGYPYLTYVAGEIFDVIGEKGELWLAKNQDDPNSQVGWIWNKHFAKLAAQ